MGCGSSKKKQKRPEAEVQEPHEQGPPPHSFEKETTTPRGEEHHRPVVAETDVGGEHHAKPVTDETKVAAPGEDESAVRQEKPAVIDEPATESSTKATHDEHKVKAEEDVALEEARQREERDRKQRERQEEEERRSLQDEREREALEVERRRAAQEEAELRAKESGEPKTIDDALKPERPPAEPVHVNTSEEMRRMEEEEARSMEREKREAERERVLEAHREVERRKNLDEETVRKDEEIRRKDEEDAQNPELVSVLVVFVKEVRQLYRFHLPKDNCTVIELKIAIGNDFGYSLKLQRLYFRNRRLQDSDVITQLPKWSSSNVLHFFPMEVPRNPPEHIYRPQQKDVTLEDLCVKTAEEARVGADVFRVEDMEQFEEPMMKGEEEEAAELERLRIGSNEKFFELAKDGCRSVLSGDIDPVPMFGLVGTGGSVYYYKGLLLRRANRWEVAGENCGEGDIANKVVGHEARALQLMRQAGIRGVIVPMTCVVEYMGVKFLVTSLLPLNHQSLVYGSSTNGLVVNRDAKADSVAQEVAKHMHLKPHVVQEESTAKEIPLATPYSVEFHRRVEDDSTGPLHLISAARLLVPDVSEGETSLVDMVSKMLRPEFVSQYVDEDGLIEGYEEVELDNPAGKSPARITAWKKEGVDEYCLVKPCKLILLNPDAFREDQETSDLDDLHTAHNYLVSTVIPNFIAEVDNLRVDVNTGDDLVEAMHAAGVNARYLGKIVAGSTLGHVREIAAREILARTIRALIRDGLSFAAENGRDPASVFVHYLNEIFSDSAEGHLTVWKYIEELSKKKFGFPIDRSMKDQIYCTAVVHSVSERMHIVLSRSKRYDLSSDVPFDIDDVVRVDCAVKYRELESKELEVIVDEAIRLDSVGKRSKWYIAGGPERELATEKFREAVRFVEAVFGKKHERTAELYADFAQHLESRHSEKGRPEYSRWNKCMFVPSDPLSDEATYYYTKAAEILLEIRGDWDLDIAECYEALGRLYKGAIPESFADLSEEEQVEKYEPCRLLKSSIEIHEALLGFNHPKTADAYANLALLYSEASDSASASPYVRKAFVVTHSIFGPDHEETLDVLGHLRAIETKCEDGLEKIDVHDLCSRIEELEFEEEDDVGDVRLDRIGYGSRVPQLTY